MSGRSDAVRLGSFSFFLLAVAAALSSCTLTRTSVDDCTRNSECRASFGLGSVCKTDGICEKALPAPRCTTTFPVDLLTRPESYPNALVIGSMMDRSVAAQIQRENAIRLAVKQVNEEGGLDGRLFGVVMCDVAENPQYDSLKRTDAAIASGRYLADTIGVSVVVGPSASADALAVFNAIKDFDVVDISPAATSPSLTGADVTQASDETPGLLWRTAPPDTLQGAAIVERVRTEFPTVTNVTIIQEKGAYGDALANVFKTGFEQEGRTATVLSFSTSSQRDLAIVQAADAGAPILLFFSSQTKDAVDFLNAAKDNRKYDTTQFFLTDSAANNDLLTGAAGASALFPRVTGSRPAVPAGQAFDLLRTSFTGEYRVDPSTASFVPHSYDATWLAFYGTVWAQRREGRITGKGIARGLRRLSSGGPEILVAPGTWRAIVDTFTAGDAVNITGTSSPLDFDPVTEETSSLVDIWQIQTDPGQPSRIVSRATIDPR